MAQSLEESFDHYNTPQFFDFDEINDRDEEYNYRFNDENEITMAMDPLNTSDFHDETTLLLEEFEDMKIANQKNFRRSMSVGDLQTIEAHIHKLRNGKLYTTDETQGTSRYESSSSLSTMLVPTLEINESLQSKTRARAVSRETINRLAMPKKTKSEQTLNDYVPMAEALIKFQSGTPKRFRSKPVTKNEVLMPTVAYTPKLQTAVRNRPVYTLSQSEKEKLALEEAQKAQFKANPMNKKVFKPPVLSAKPKKSTVPEPFKLTATAKTVASSPVQKAPEFHARPVPKYVYEPQQPTIKAPLNRQLTKPQTPSFLKRYHKSPSTADKNKNEDKAPQPRLKPTKPLPFSFEMREKMIKNKRAALMEKILESEKKAREFHAKPIPKCVFGKTGSSKGHNGSIKSLSSTATNKSDDSLNSTNAFKARPPTVLYKKPFEPKKPQRPLLEINEFTLNTDIRKQERELFERQIHERDEKIKQLKEEQEIIRKQQEAEEVLRARKMAEFKAHVTRKYKELKVVPSMKITNPVSPKFLSKGRQHENKENAVD